MFRPFWVGAVHIVIDRTVVNHLSLFVHEENLGCLFRFAFQKKTPEVFDKEIYDPTQELV